MVILYVALETHPLVQVRSMRSHYKRDVSKELKCEQPFLKEQIKFTLLCIATQDWPMPQEDDYSISCRLQCFS